VGQRGGHYPITLEATQESGWLTRDMLDALITRSRTRAATYTLNYNSTNYTVRFRHEQGGGPIQMRQLQPIASPDGDTYYYGKIYLMCTG
jgi:hypothetical protein